MTKNIVADKKIINIKQNNKRFLLWLMFCMAILMVNLCSAGITQEFIRDEQKILDKNTETTYGKYIIEETKWWDILKIWTGETIKEVTLENNTDVCSDNCLAITKITNLKPAPLIEEVRFYRDFGDGKWVLWNGFTNWNIQVEEDVDIFETQCIQSKEIGINGTYNQECSQVKIRTEKQWLPLDMKKEYNGTYNVKLNGGKKPSTILDWQIKMNGVWSDEWAVWGEIGEYIGECYQETANVSTACGGLDTGSYSLSGDAWDINSSFLYDGDWDTYSGKNTTSTTSYFNINYTKPTGVDSSSKWKIKTSAGETNLTITEECWNYNEDILQLRIASSGGGTVPTSHIASCYSGSWETLDTGAPYPDYIYEEAMIWILPDAEVRLNSPSNGAIAYVNPITFNASANVTGGATLVNMSFCSNVTSSWNCENGTDNMTNFGYSNPYNTKNSSNSGGVTGTLILKANITVNKYVENSTLECTTSGQGHTCTGVFKYNYVNGTTTNLTVVSGSGVNNPSNGTISNPLTNLKVSSIQVFVNATTYNPSYPPIYTATYVSNKDIIKADLIFSKTISSSTLWNVKGCDSDGDCGFATSNYTVSLDTTPPTITINSGNGTQDYGSVSQNHTINYTITDTNLDTCWIDYNYTNTTIPCTSGEINTTNFTLQAGIYNATIYANDTVGNNVSQLVQWDYIFFEEEINYNTFVYETSEQEFSIKMSTDVSILLANSKLIYDGESYTGVSSCTNGDCYFSRTIDIPKVSSGVSELKEFYWELNLFDGSDSYSLNTTALEQNVSRIYLEKCNGTYTTKTMNLSAYREDNLTRINLFSISGSFDFWLGNGSEYRTSSFTNSSIDILELCISPTNLTYYSNAQIEYSFEDENITYTPREYQFQNLSLTNVTNDVRLYLLEEEKLTTFIIKVQDEKLSPVKGVIVEIYRYYPSDNEFRLVQSATTDSSGETIGFYKTETVDYKHIIKRGQTTLLETSKQKVVGKTVPFTLTFTIGVDLGYPWDPFIKDEDINSSITYNRVNQTVTFTYLYEGEDTLTARFLVLQESLSNYSSTIICNNSSSLTAATFTCDVSDYSGTIYAYGYFNEEVVDFLSFIITTAKDIFGREGLFIGLFIVLVSGFAFLWNPSAGVVAINAAVIFTNIIGFITLSPIFIFGMIAISFIAIILFKT